MSELYVINTIFQVYLDRLKQLRRDERGRKSAVVFAPQGLYIMNLNDYGDYDLARAQAPTLIV